MSGPTPDVPRCSLAARGRGDTMMATALPVERFLLLEIPGPWVPDVWASAGLPLDVTRFLQDAVERIRARIVLIRRPGRHPAADGGLRRWAVVSRSGARWGSWRSSQDLSGLDLAAELRQPATASPLVLACTHGRHDVCCAIEGRPVATLLASIVGLDVWECSHLGGDRFAANVLWLPKGWMLGGVLASNVATVAEAALAGRVLLPHFRGRSGDTSPAQAAQYFLMDHLGEDSPDAVVVEPAHPGSTSLIATHNGQHYRVMLEATWTTPHHLTCRAVGNARMRAFRLVSLEPVAAAV